MSIPAEWQIYDLINESLKSGDTESALKQISETRGETRRIAPDIARLEAECYQRRGDRNRALAILEHAVENYSKSYWVYYSIARCVVPG
jgi:uncharacterized protein HemY